MDYIKTSLSNKLRVIMVPMPHLKSATLAFYVANGSRYEKAEISGLSHFLEHMLFKGSENFPTAKDIFGAIERVGGVLNGWTDTEATSYWAKVPSSHVLAALEVLTNLTFRPLFNPEELDKERQVVLEEVARKNDHPEDLAAENLGELLWPEQSVGRSTLGSPESLKNIDTAKMADYYRSQYAAGNIIFGISGSFDESEVKEYLNGNLPSHLEPFPKIVPAPAKESQSEPRLKIADKKTDQTHLCLGFKSYSLTHPRRFPLLILNAILGGGASSRLFQNIRETLGLAYAVGSSADFLTDTGETVIQAGLNSEKLNLALTEILKEVTAIKDAAVTIGELTLAKEMLKGHFLLGLEDSHSVLDFFVHQEILTNKIITPEEVIRRLNEVTTIDVQEAAREIFTPQNLSLSLVSPVTDPAPLKKILASFR